MIRVNKTKIVIGLCLVLGLTGCQESSVKRDKPAPPLSADFAPDGHLALKPKVESSVSDSAGIPQLVDTQIPSLPPLGGSSQSDTYSISAVGVPVGELLFKIAQDANRDIDIYAGVQGNITINALNQPLETILDRMADQAGFVFDLVDNTIIIKPDLPEWRNYKVDYVNITKSSSESIDMQMSVSSGVGDGGTSGGSPASSTQVKVESKHDFWANLEKNIKLLAQLDPNANKVLLPQNSENGNAPRPLELSSVSQNTVVNGEAGVISVFTTVKQHKAIKKYIEEVTHRAEKQVLIEATVVEVELNDQYQSGVDWTFLNSKAFGDNGGISISSPFGGNFDGFQVSTNDFGSSAIGFVTGDWNILANLNLLDEFGDSKVLSSPKIMAVNNQTALLKVVENLVYFTIDVNTSSTQTTSLTTYETEVNTIPVGFTMSVTPFVSDSGDVTLNVRPTITKQIGFVTDPNPSLTVVESRIPVIQEKEMSSVLRLKDRQTAIIGGLIEDSNSNSKAGIPWLGDVPVVGDLFSKRDDATVKRELIIFIRPTIINNPDVDHGDLVSVSRFLDKSKKY